MTAAFTSAYGHRLRADLVAAALDEAYTAQQRAHRLLAGFAAHELPDEFWVARTGQIRQLLSATGDLAGVLADRATDPVVGALLAGVVSALAEAAADAGDAQGVAA